MGGLPVALFAVHAAVHQRQRVPAARHRSRRLAVLYPVKHVRMLANEPYKVCRELVIGYSVLSSIIELRILSSIVKIVQIYTLERRGAI